MQCKRHTLSFASPVIMGVLNVTPDSFSDGGQYLDVDNAVARAKEMVAEGAGIIDVGGESSRPGSDPVSEQDELTRVIPVIERLAGLDVPVSIDTHKPRVADLALAAGASMINDIGGMPDEMHAIAKKHGVPVVVMHMQGTPKTMQQDPQYDDVVAEIIAFFRQRIERAEVPLILDPGIGFGKTLAHNLEILRRLDEIASLGHPVLIGASRKSFINAIDSSGPEERLPGTIAANTVAIMNGARILRVHDVKECKQAAKVAEAIRG